MRNSLLILKVGEPAPMVREELGSYERWFLWRFDDMKVRTPVRVHDMRSGERPTRPGEDFPAAVLITGSPESIYDGQPWIPEAKAWLKDAIAADVPILGVCFGHQLLAELLGGRVGRNPLGWEFGTAEITLTPEGLQDPLFEGLSSPLISHEAHQDVVLELPPGATVLATSPRDPHHALRLRERVWSVQFHPEMRGMHVGAVFAGYAQRLHKEGLDRGLRPGEFVLECIKSMREEDDGEAVLRRFLALAVD